MNRSTPVKHEPDVFQRTFSGAFDRLGGAVVAISGALVLILVAAALIWGFTSWRDKSQAAAWDTMGKAMDERDPDRQATLLEEALKEASGEARAAVLMTLAARLHDRAISEGPPAEGSRAAELRRPRELCEEFLRDFPGHRLAVRVRANLAGILEDSGDFEPAMAAYRAAAAACVDTEFAFMHGELLWGQARCAQRLGQNDEALRRLDEALSRKGSAGSGWEAAAKLMYDRLRPAERKLLVDKPASDEPPPPPQPPGKEPAGTEKPAPPAPGAGEKPPAPTPKGTEPAAPGGAKG